MGLLDILGGAQGGSAGQSSTGGMSPIALALIGLVAGKLLQGGGGQPAAGSGDGQPAAGGGLLGGLLQSVTGGGGLGSLLQGGGAGGLLGGLLGGANAGGLLSGGLGDLVRQLQDSGHGDVVKSWVGNGDNQPIAPGDLAKALGSDKIDALATQSGLSRDDLLVGLAQHLPAFVNHLTPNGRLPTAEEAAQAAQ